MTTFQGRDGQEWTVDRADRIAPRGGFGQVCRGKSFDDEIVAVKIVTLPETTELETRRREREVVVASKLQDLEPRPKHLLLSLDYAVVENDLFIVMPLASHSLAKHCRGGAKLPEDEAAEVLLQVSTGLEELARATILHRDLKPDNVLWHEGVWKLSDFGLSRDLEQATSLATLAPLGGTQAYMAPEAWERRRLTPQADLYALGIMAIELLTGDVPFYGQESADFFYQHINSLPDVPGNLDPRFELLIKQLVSKRVAERPQDARSVSEALRRLGVSVNPIQEELLKSRAFTVAKRQQKEVEQRQESERQEALRGTQTQALTELKRILEEAKALLGQIELPTDSDIPEGARYGILPFGDVALLVETDSPNALEGELVDYGPTIHVGSVQALKSSSEPGGYAQRISPVLANIVCRREADGRLIWYGLRIQRRVDATLDSSVAWLGLKCDGSLIENVGEFWGRPETEGVELTPEWLLRLLSVVAREHSD